jgi:hypothetical protein
MLPGLTIERQTETNFWGKMNKQRHYIEVCRYNNIVYLRTLKCASTFFYWNFTKHLDWQEIAWSDIDWENDHVFTHMLEPVQRRHKAVAERLSMFGLCEQYLADANLRECLEHALILDQHSESYTTRYGSACQHIDWIPLQPSNQRNVQLTELLLAHNGVTDINWDYSFAHPGEDIKKQVEQQLARTWHQALYQDRLLEWQQNHLQLDLDLYVDIVKRVNLQGLTWSEITWLRNK